MRYRRLAAGLVAALAATAAPAHHSFVMFDHDHTITLDNGKVEMFQWTNPHAYLTLLADEPGGLKRYTLEMTSINMMSRGGWTSRTIKPGERIKAIVAPLRDGQAGGLVLEVTLPNGKVMLPGVPNAHTFKRTTQ